MTAPQRKRVVHTTSLEARMLKFAEKARADAEALAPGMERDKLLKKARDAQAMADAANRLRE